MWHWVYVLQHFSVTPEMTLYNVSSEQWHNYLLWENSIFQLVPGNIDNIISEFLSPKEYLMNAIPFTKLSEKQESWDNSGQFSAIILQIIIITQ